MAPPSIEREFGEGVRKVVATPFDLAYALCPDLDPAGAEALVPQRVTR